MPGSRVADAAGRQRNAPLPQAPQAADDGSDSCFESIPGASPGASILAGGGRFARDDKFRQPRDETFFVRSAAAGSRPRRMKLAGCPARHGPAPVRASNASGPPREVGSFGRISRATMRAAVCLNFPLVEACGSESGCHRCGQSGLRGVGQLRRRSRKTRKTGPVAHPPRAVPPRHTPRASSRRHTPRPSSRPCPWRRVPRAFPRATCAVRHPPRRHPVGPKHHQIVILTPSSTTRSLGIRKNSVAGTAFRAMNRNSAWRHHDSFGAMPGTRTSRPRK